MIVHLDCDISAVLEINSAILAEQVAEIARAHRLGHHLVIIRPDLADWISKNLILSEFSKSTIERIGQNFSQTADLIRRSSIVLRIRPSHSGPPRREGKFIDMSLLDHSMPFVLERAVFVLEDAETDARFYEKIFEHAKSKIGIFVVSWEAAHGGGSRTIEIALKKAEDRRIVCAIIDSDKIAPNANPLPKIIRIEKHALENEWPILLAASARCREIENLIPYEIVRHLPCAADNKHLPIIEGIASAEHASKCDPFNIFWLYFDLKKGLKINKIDEIKDEFDRNWLQGKLFSAVKSKNFSTLQGFGDNVVAQLLEAHELNGELRRTIRSDKWWLLFGDYISDLMWICAATQKQYT